MRLLVLAAATAVLAVLGGAGAIPYRPGNNLIDEGGWMVASKDDDHITYVRQPVEDPEPENNVDCNQTTTTAAPPTTVPTRRRSSRFGVRSGAEGRRTTGMNRHASRHQDGFDGDATWVVSQKDDDSITYVRRSSSGQRHTGELRRLGSGQNSVMARVVVPGKEDDATEEGLLDSHSQSSRYSGYKTGDLVHPYAKKTQASASSNTRTQNLKSGASRRGNMARQAQSQTPPNLPPGGDDHPPRVGEVVNGWVVVSKSKDHISWSRWGSTPKQTPATSVANLRARNTANESRLKALNTEKRRQIPNYEGKLVEGFPRVFDTYSRSYFVHERNIDQAGSIRTSMSDTKNWKVGDELAGWKVISKDPRGIVWQKMNNGDENEEDFLNQLNRNDEDASSESDSSSESKSNEDDGDNKYNGPPGTWYLAKETKNSIKWKRDNTPADVIFDMDAYPRIGDIQSGWKVLSKARDHIKWVRVNSDGSEVSSNETS